MWDVGPGKDSMALDLRDASIGAAFERSDLDFDLRNISETALA